MKKIINSLLIFAILIGSLFSVSFAYGNWGANQESLVSYLPYENLSQVEIDGILKMREEEKLARDVYLEMYDMYSQKVFSNIASAEQKHMDVMGELIEKYNLEDPIKTDDRGVFTNQDLQDLYNQLVKQGSKSLVSALKVGATIEDLDIYDLIEEKSLTDNQDIKVAYENLEKGSRNHMRAFTSNLNMIGADYINQYINYSYYNQIISSENERGNIMNSNLNSNNVRGNVMNSNMNLVNKSRDVINTNAYFGNQNQEKKIFSYFGNFFHGFFSWFK